MDLVIECAQLSLTLFKSFSLNYEIKLCECGCNELKLTSSLNFFLFLFAATIAMSQLMKINEARRSHVIIIKILLFTTNIRASTRKTKSISAESERLSLEWVINWFFSSLIVSKNLACPIDTFSTININTSTSYQLFTISIFRIRMHWK
jgi:hypothetical protein